MSRKNLWRCLVVAFALAFALSFAGVSFGVWNSPVQLTDNSIHDYGAEISGNNIVWQAYDPALSGVHDIVFYDGSVSTTLTNHDRYNWEPKIDGNQAVWWALDGADFDIFHYDGSHVTTLTANDVDDTGARISGNNIVWNRNDGNDNEVMLSNGTTETSITNNLVDDLAPEISGNNIVWFAWDGNDNEIMFYNGTNTTTLTANSVDDMYPQISGNNVVWQRYDGSDYEIMLYKDGVETTLTNNSVYDGEQAISGSNVVWRTNTPGNLEIMFYNGSMPTTISISPYDDVGLRLSGNRATWYSSNGPSRFVYVFDGAGTHAIPTPYSGQNARISGNRLVWDTLTEPDAEIYKYDFDFSKPGDPGVTGAAPPKDTWTNDNTVLVNFSGGADTVSGVDGYSVSWSNAPLTLPDAVKDLEESAGSALSPPLADGNQYFHLRTLDNAGNWTSTIHYGPFKIDTASPTAFVKAPAKIKTAAGTARFRISWSGSDSGSGVKTYDVGYKIGKRGRWKSWKTGAAALRARFTAKVGKTYYFRARAKDKAGNTGAWSRLRRTVVSRT